MSYTQKELDDQTRRRNNAQSERELEQHKADSIRIKRNDDIRERQREDEMMATFYRCLNR